MLLGLHCLLLLDGGLLEFSQPHYGIRGTRQDYHDKKELTGFQVLSRD